MYSVDVTYPYGSGDPEESWFTIGRTQVTTTILLTAASVAVLIASAIDPTLPGFLSFDSDAILGGQVWRIISWPAAAAINIFEVISIAFFFLIGSRLEQTIGKAKFTNLLITIGGLSMAAIITLSFLTGLQGTFGGLGVFTLALIVAIAVMNPFAPSFFQIPIWILAAVFLGFQILGSIASRDWAGLIVVVGGSAVAAGYMIYWGRAHEVISEAPIGQIVTEQKQKRSHLQAVPDVSEEEMNALLDKISEHGMKSLTKEEKKKLKSFSKKR